MIWQGGIDHNSILYMDNRQETILDKSCQLQPFWR